MPPNPTTGFLSYLRSGLYTSALRCKPLLADHHLTMRPAGDGNVRSWSKVHYQRSSAMQLRKPDSGSYALHHCVVSVYRRLALALGTEAQVTPDGRCTRVVQQPGTQPRSQHMLKALPG